MPVQKTTYKTLRPFPHHGRVIPTGETVAMVASQAKYLLGTHLREAEASTPTKAKAKSTTKTTGDQ